jgi:hypothetical protein
LQEKIKLIAARLSGKLNDSTDYGAFTLLDLWMKKGIMGL